MELNTTAQLEQDLDTPLAEPHFDEEATLLSARPVVPLEEIVALERSGKRLAFGVAMVFSLLVGALGGALIYKLRGHKDAAVIVNTAVPGADGIAVGEPVSVPSVAQQVTEAGTGKLPESSVATAEIRSAPSGSLPVGSSRVEMLEKKSPSQAEGRDDERELRRAERIEAHRLRRRLEREADREARHQRNRSDDVLRIREIFEGSRRP